MFLQGFEIYTKALTRPAAPAPSTPKKVADTAAVESPHRVTDAPSTPTSSSSEEDQKPSASASEESENSVKMASLDDAVEEEGEEVVLNTEELIDGLQVTFMSILAY
jgi:hypothetical protein